MTVEDAGKTAAEGVWVTLKTLKEQWVLVMFVAGALIWARDTYEQFSRLPLQIGEQATRLEKIVGRVSALERKMAERAEIARGPIVEFPGTRHSIGDARPGDWTTVKLDPIVYRRSGCRISRLDAFMVDSRDQWFTAEIGLDRLPRLRNVTDLAFEVRVHPRMARGRAKAVIQFTHDCGSFRKVETAPTLPFRVLGD